MKARLPKEYQTRGAGNMNDMLRQAQVMQDSIKKIQDELKDVEYTVEAAGGMVELTMTGAKVLKTIKISPDIVDKDNIEDLEDIITVGVNAAITKVEQEAEKEMEKATGGINIPGLV
ncbi:MAG: YbaB/EbfC family nucleoid-associated protein [Oscillospiraceae bacterium]|nr:YbaB/EbfC family nucleoid-associated protein [Oscillospiraceae bacterium]